MSFPVRSPRGHAAVFVQRLLIPLLFLVLPVAALAQTGTITGTVTNAAGGAPLAGVQVGAFMVPSLQSGNIASTDASGVFSIPDLQPGTYVLVTINSQGFIDEVWDNQACPGGCSTTDGLVGVPIAVSAGSTVSGRNFALDFGGRVSGTVTNAATNLPLQNVSVFLYLRTPSGATFARTGSTNAAGAYTVSGLPAGTYFAQTSNSQGFVNEIYDNVTCVGSCLTSTMLASGTPIPVTLGNTTAGRDFALETGGRVAGTVIDAATSAPVQNVGVSVYTRVGTTTVFANSTTTNAAGEYTVQGLAAGTYFAFTSNSVGYMNEIYDNIQCPVNCSSTVAVDSGAAIPVTLGGTTAGRNFALEMGGSITGVITSQDTGLPLQGIRVEVFRRIGTSNFFANSAMTDASGVYTVRGLPTANYWAYTSTSQNLINEIFDNVECRGACSQANAVSLGTPIPVTQGTSTGSRNFALRTGGAVSGTITDAITGLPLSGVGLEVWMQVGSSITFVGVTSSDSSGLYTFRGLDAGNYVVDTFGAHGYRNEVFDDIPCLGGFCPVSTVQTGTPIPVALGATTSGRNFGLLPGEILGGIVTDAATGARLPGVTVNIYQRTGSGVFIGSSTTNLFGVWALRGVPNGSYAAYTSSSIGYFNEIFDNIRCTTNCSAATAVASGTPIEVTGAATLVGGINFALDARNVPPAAPSGLTAVTSGFTTQFTWNAVAGATGYVLEAGVSPGTTIVTIPTTGPSHLQPGVPPGTFYIRVRAVNAFGTGPASAEIVLSVAGDGFATPEPPRNVQAFMNGGRLTVTWAAPLSGGLPSGYVVEAGSATGLANIAALPVSGRSFTFSPVPNGFYFLRIRTRVGTRLSAPSTETMLVIGNVPSPPGPPNFTSVQVSGATVTLNWVAPSSGAPTSYIVEAGSATGLSNLAVANTGSSATSVSFGGVPSGTYYVRIRAVNALGASVVSNERTVVVP